MYWTASAAVLLGLGVMIGAFGAHGLRGKLDAYSMDVYERAVLYHFIHAIGLFLVALLPRIGVLSTSRASVVCWLLLAGVLIFSGSLYTLAITGVKTLGAITPLGGLSFIAAWLLLAWFLVKPTV